MVFSRRGITRMRMPAMRDTSGPMLRCRFMGVFLLGVVVRVPRPAWAAVPREAMILRDRCGRLCVVEQTLGHGPVRLGGKCPGAYRVASLGARLISLFC